MYISSDAELEEAISYHDAGDGTSSSRSSISSMRSRRITIEVQIRLHDDGPSLSDSSSLSSREEYEERNESQYSFSLNGSVDGPVDDDARTVSSRDTGSSGVRSSKSPNMLRKLLDPSSRSLGSSSQNRTQRPQQLRKSASQMLSLASRSRREDPQDDDAATELGTEPMASGSGRSTYSRANEVSIYAQLKREEVQQGPSIGPWLEQQESRVIKSMPIPVPSDADTFSLNTDTPFSDGEGPFADQISIGRNHRGEKRYTYRSSASDASRDEFEIHVQQGKLYSRHSHHRPFSLDTRSSESGDQVSSGYPMSSQLSFRHLSTSDAPPPPPSESFTIPSELLIPDDVTDCSECGTILDNMRYICTTCGEKPAAPRAELEVMRFTAMSQSRDTLDTECPPHAYEYPPMHHRVGGPSSSTSSDTLRTIMPGQARLGPPNGHHHPRTKSNASSSSLVSSTTTLHPGYELCPSCVQLKGVNHSLLGDGNDTSPISPKISSSPQDLAVARRSAPRQMGQLRHAFAEKIWGTDGWQDLGERLFREYCG